MKISPIRVNRPSFGYDKDYHKWLKKELKDAGRYNETANALLELEKTTIDLEEKLLAIEESKGVDTAKYEIYSGGLVALKGALAYYMEAYFPRFNFCDEELHQYYYEMDESKNEMEYAWRDELFNSLNDLKNAQLEELEKYAKQNIEEEDMYYDLKVSIEEQLAAKKARNETEEERKAREEAQALEEAIAAKKASLGNLLTEFIPTNSSPKSFDDVVGMEETKIKLQEDIIDYVENPELIQQDKEEYGIEACGTILFYGPPGCGKTYITEALAVQSGLKMFKMDISKIGSKYINQTSGNIQKIFDYLEDVARYEDKPVLLFIDELDSLGIKRESSAGSSGENLKTTSTLLKLIQEAKDKNIIIIGATNRRNTIDAALLDRFSAETYFGLPDERAIKKILTAKLGKITKGQKLAQDEKLINELAKSLKGYSNRTIVHIIQEAAKLAKRNSRSEITFEIFNKAIKECKHDKINENIYQKEKDRTRTIGFA